MLSDVLRAPHKVEGPSRITGPVHYESGLVWNGFTAAYKASISNESRGVKFDPESVARPSQNGRERVWKSSSPERTRRVI